MLDMKVIRQNPERVKEAMRHRGGNKDALVEEILQIDLRAAKFPRVPMR